MQTSAGERRQREMDEAKARIREGMLASTNGAVGSGSDPLDLVRSDPAFQSALGKLGKDATVLYDTEIWSLLQHAEDGTSMTANFGSGRVALSAEETQQLASFLSLSGSVTYGENGSVDSSMALVARSGASLDDVNATVRGALGKFVTDWDLSGLTSGVHASNGVIDRSVALNLMPLQETVLERFNISIYGNPRSVAAYEAYEQASNELINPYRESTTTYKQQALNSYQRITGSIRSDLVDQGYLPARIAFSERATGIYEGIGSLMLGVIPAERLAAPILKGVMNAARGIAPFVRAESMTGRVMAQYQTFYDQSYAAAVKAHEAGRIRVPPGMKAETVIGRETDLAVTRRLQLWLEREGISPDDVMVNRRLYDPAGSGSFRRPDIRIPSEGTIIDGTIGTKTLATPQIRDFIRYSQGNTVIIVRPNQPPTLLYQGAGL